MLIAGGLFKVVTFPNLKAIEQLCHSVILIGSSAEKIEGVLSGECFVRCSVSKSRFKKPGFSLRVRQFY